LWCGFYWTTLHRELQVLVNVRLMLVYSSEILDDSNEPLPEILHRPEHNFFALRFGKSPAVPSTARAVSERFSWSSPSGLRALGRMADKHQKAS
jgi:hypothetical protein